jgi:hypothetical protein
MNDFTALLLPENTPHQDQLGQHRSIPPFGCGEAAVGERQRVDHAARRVAPRLHRQAVGVVIGEIAAAAEAVGRRGQPVGQVISERHALVERVGAGDEPVGRVIDKRRLVIDRVDDIDHVVGRVRHHRGPAGEGINRRRRPVQGVIYKCRLVA